MSDVVYPGTFDPITKGHLDLIYRALNIFDTVIIAVSTNSSKRPLFTQVERLSMIKAIFTEIPSVKVCAFDGLLVDFLAKLKVTAILRGLRAVSDFEYEFQMASINRHMSEHIETLFLTPDDKYTCLSSTLIREVAKIDPERIAQFVHPIVLKALEQKKLCVIKAK